MPIVITRRTPDSIAKHGTNCFVEWKPDSNMLVVAVSEKFGAFENRKLIFCFFHIIVSDQRWHIVVVYAVGGGHTERHLQSNRSAVQKFVS